MTHHMYSAPLVSILAIAVFVAVVCLAVRICGDIGISCDSLDVCFGDQLAGSTHEPMHRGWHTFSS